MVIGVRRLDNSTLTNCWSQNRQRMCLDKSFVAFGLLVPIGCIRPPMMHVDTRHNRRRQYRNGIRQYRVTMRKKMKMKTEDKRDRE